MARSVATTSSGILFAMFVCISAAWASEPVAYTGCLKVSEGTLYNMQIGDRPLAPCKDRDTVVTWNQEGPKGPAGPVGEPGPIGPPGPASIPLTFEFVGTTTQSFLGDGTRDAMNRACNEEYPGSRMAFADEYRSTSNPSSFNGLAWLDFRPSIATLTLEANTSVILIDPSGTVLRVNNPEGRNLSCDQWSSTTGSGAAVASGGRFGLAGCSQAMPVACATPIQE